MEDKNTNKNLLININMDEKNMSNLPKESIPTSKPNEVGGVSVQGHIKIYDPVSKEFYINKRNAIHYENFSIALAQSIANQGEGPIAEMVFGNGGSRVDSTGIITYLTPNNVGSGASLYNQTYYKTVDEKSDYSFDPARNFMETRHIAGVVYTDVLVSCLLDFGEPSGQAAFDNATSTEGNFVFDELGLKSFNPEGPNTGLLLTHVIFHPVQKSLNRMIQVDYTIRIQSLSTGI
jgi:hypothetical protein